MNSFPKPCFWLILNHYGTLIISFIFGLVLVETTMK